MFLNFHFSKIFNIAFQNTIYSRCPWHIPVQTKYSPKPTFFVHIDAAGLPVMYVAAVDHRIRVQFNFNARDPITVDVALLKYALSVLKRKNSDVTSVVYVASSKHRIRVVLHPYTGQIVTRNLAVLKTSDRVVTNVDADVLAVAYYAMLNARRGQLFHAQRSTN